MPPPTATATATSTARATLPPEAAADNEAAQPAYGVVWQVLLGDTVVVSSACHAVALD